MDDKTLQALNALADKLGTTAEHLWGVLIRQAPISGCVELISLIICLVPTAVVGRVLYKRAQNNDFYQDVYFFSFVSVFLVLLVFDSALISRIDIIIAAFINPEYWALMQILNQS